jgi:hypothetical protein
MDLYAWSFDSIHSHCHDDVNAILNILKNFKEFWAKAHLRNTFRKNGMSGNLPIYCTCVYIYVYVGITASIHGMKKTYL